MIQAILVRFIVRKITMSVIKRLLKSKKVVGAVVLLIASAFGIVLNPEIFDAIVLIVTTASEAQ